MNMPRGFAYGPFDDEERKYYYYGREHSYWSNLEKQVKDNLVKKDRITEAATRIIAPMYLLNQMDNYPSVDIYMQTNTEERKKLQRKVATESQVL